MLWNDHLFKVRGIIPSLPESVAEKFHTFTAQRLFFCKRERRNIHPEIANITTRARSHNENK